MVTTAERYNAYLHIIQNANPPTYAALPTANNIYNIDIKTREISAPLFLAVEKDNISETIYFIVDRYADYMDLSTTNCVITYTNALGITRVYIVPFYDIYSYASENKMIIPWNLDAGVAEAAGTVEFALQFFKVVEQFNYEKQEKEKIISYSLNTQVAQSKVLSGIQIQDIGETYKLSPTEFEQVSSRIAAVEEIFKNDYWPSWTIITE